MKDEVNDDEKENIKVLDETDIALLKHYVGKINILL
jgi:hypothetical protein